MSAPNLTLVTSTTRNGNWDDLSKFAWGAIAAYRVFSNSDSGVTMPSSDRIELLRTISSADASSEQAIRVALLNFFDEMDATLKLLADKGIKAWRSAESRNRWGAVQGASIRQGETMRIFLEQKYPYIAFRISTARRSVRTHEKRIPFFFSVEDGFTGANVNATIISGPLLAAGPTFVELTDGTRYARIVGQPDFVEGLQLSFGTPTVGTTTLVGGVATNAGPLKVMSGTGFANVNLMSELQMAPLSDTPALNIPAGNINIRATAGNAAYVANGIAAQRLTNGTPTNNTVFAVPYRLWAHPFALSMYYDRDSQILPVDHRQLSDMFSKTTVLDGLCPAAIAMQAQLKRWGAYFNQLSMVGANRRWGVQELKAIVDVSSAVGQIILEDTSYVLNQSPDLEGEQTIVVVLSLLRAMTVLGNNIR